MRHTVTISIAPVVCVLDDAAEPVTLLALPLSIALYLPCQLYVLLASLSWQIPRLLAGVRAYAGGWKSDLALISAAVDEAWRAWVGCPAWAVGTG